MKNQKIFKYKEFNKGIKRGKMRSQATAKLIAQTDTTCEFLLNLFKKLKAVEFTKIKKHIDIDNTFLDSKLGILKEANLIKNNTISDEKGQEIDRIFSLTPDGEKALIELGYYF